jgi:hypothetical protein
MRTYLILAVLVGAAMSFAASHATRPAVDCLSTNAAQLAAASE